MSTDAASAVSSPAWRRFVRRLFRPFLILLALIFLIEAWLWSHLAPVVAWVVARIPLRAIKARVARAIEHLPPYATLLVFLIPIIVLFPLKLVGLWMLAHGSWLGAVTTIAAAKLIGTGLTAFIFDVTRDKLLQLAWFKRVYEIVLGLLARAHALVDPVKRRIKLWFRVFSPKRAGRSFRLMMRIRRRMHAT
jgi:hypothetical protein